MLKNRKKLELKVEEDRSIFEEILKPSDSLKEYEDKRIELCVSHSEKKENGEPIIENEKYKIIDVKLFENELQSLSDEYKDALNDRKSQIEEYNKLMLDDVVVDFDKVKFEDLPADISENQLRSIEFMIDLE